VRLLQRSSKPPGQGARYCVLTIRLIYLNAEVLSIGTLSGSRGLFNCVSFKSLFCWERGFVNKHTIWAIGWPSVEVWLLVEGIQVDWKVRMLRKRGNQDLTSFESQGLCRTGSNCQSPSYASIPRDIDAFLRFRVSIDCKNRWFFVSVELFYKGQLSWSTEGGGTNWRNLVY
jgi:hypothetical protein